ncbi:hypothetical protein ACJIZ3_022130 [Penstemon smallii]|uniref:CBM20 domain-containing protein n=1 Tax=Penstemon smallii TaxID=265156 RepID=A0ABD3SND4_9LAMI
MKTLSGSYLKFSPCKFGGGGGENEATWSSRRFAMNRQEIAFLGNQKRFSIGFRLSVSNSSAKPLSHTQLQDNVTTEDIHEVYRENPKTVQVRFNLQKQCDFGQHFLIVGDHPIIGSWKSSDGVPLNWSEGHVWTVDLDMPIGELIKYKFILKEQSGNITWQQGPDRVFTTWESEKRIIVSEDWYNPNLQNITEEEDELIIANGHPVVSDEELEGQDLSTTDKESVVLNVEVKEEEKVQGAKEETKIVSDEEVAVLVPGLMSAVTQEEIDEALKKVERKEFESTSIGSEKVEELTAAAKTNDEEHVCVSLHHKETIEELIDKKQEMYVEEELGNSILEGDMQWGLRTLQKFLSNFGFQIS